MLTKQELDQIEREMCDLYGRNDKEATDFAFSALVRLLHDAHEARSRLLMQSKSVRTNAA